MAVLQFRGTYHFTMPQVAAFAEQILVGGVGSERRRTARFLLRRASYLTSVR